MKIPMFINRAKDSCRHFGLAVTLGILLVSNLGFALTGEKKTEVKAPSMTYRDGKISANMPSTTLYEAMKEFSRVTGIEVIWRPEEIRKPVELAFSGYSVEEAIKSLLSGESYLLFYSSTNREQNNIVRIQIVGHRKAGETSVAPATAMTNVVTMNQLDEEMRYENGYLETARTEPWNRIEEAKSISPQLMDIVSREEDPMVKLPDYLMQRIGEEPGIEEFLKSYIEHEVKNNHAF
jgi:hypothetical protein